jgi:hypothetical protein
MITATRTLPAVHATWCCRVCGCTIAVKGETVMTELPVDVANGVLVCEQVAADASAREEVCELCAANTTWARQ